MPAGDVDDSLIRITAVEAKAEAFPWLAMVKLTVTLPPGAGVEGLKVRFWTSKSGVPVVVTVSVALANTMSLASFAVPCPAVLPLSASTQTR